MRRKGRRKERKNKLQCPNLLLSWLVTTLPPLPPSLPLFICPFVQLLFSSLYSLMQLILFQLAPRSSPPFPTPIHGFYLTKKQKQRSATDAVTLPSSLQSSLVSQSGAAAGKSLRRSSVCVHEAQIFMRLLCSEQQQMMSGNNRLPVSMATSAIHSPPFLTQAGREGWEEEDEE